jgi:hypothetical protein
VGVQDFAPSEIAVVEMHEGEFVVPAGRQLRAGVWGQRAAGSGRAGVGWAVGGQGAADSYVVISMTAFSSAQSS